MTLPAPEVTDAHLIARASAGDLYAWDELYRRHLSDARRVARVVCDDREEAEDVVAEAFTRVLSRLRAGGGPDSVLTPYLRTAIRRLAVDRHRLAGGHPVELDTLPTGDDEIAPTDRQLVQEAYETLPPRWQRVLWHTEVEGRPPAALTPALGSSPNAVAALAYRAREGLHQAYLAVHQASAVPYECEPFVSRLAPFVRDALPHEEDVAVAVHLETCAHCREHRDELLLLTSNVRAVLAPALLGIAGAAGAAQVTAVGRPVTSADGQHAVESDRTGRRRITRFVATALVSVAAAVAVAFAVVSAMSPGSPSDEPAAIPPPVTAAEMPAPMESAPVARVGSPLPTETEAGPAPDPEEAVPPAAAAPAQTPPTAAQSEPPASDTELPAGGTEPAVSTSTPPAATTEPDPKAEQQHGPSAPLSVPGTGDPQPEDGEVGPDDPDPQPGDGEPSAEPTGPGPGGAANAQASWPCWLVEMLAGLGVSASQQCG